MSERWIKESEQLLRKMDELSLTENKDRLETIKSIIFAVTILERSIDGWKHWIGSLSLMSQFTLEELTEIEATLKKHIQSFVEYDIEATKKWQAKFPQIPRPRRDEGVEETRRGLVV